jgi:hypothetical protein
MIFTRSQNMSIAQARFKCTGHSVVTFDHGVCQGPLDMCLIEMATAFFGGAFHWMQNA